MDNSPDNSPASRQARPASIRVMFDRIAPTYDLLNRLISFGLDTGWRRRAIALFGEFPGGSFLDIAAGSGDISVELESLGPRLTTGTDFSTNMLRLYGDKMSAKSRNGRFGMAAADALALPFRDRSFDGTITAFGIRNFADRPLALREMHRVLRPGGLAVILELTVPENRLLRGLYSLHAKVLLPVAGTLISGDSSAYRYLPASIEAFPPPGEFLSMMEGAGFTGTGAIPLTFGAATIFHGRKP
jgi:demethylmenaquinone methyltransferase/2-methoxy-6-polyprenyl-1,4-benzoquinol methylase